MLKTGQLSTFKDTLCDEYNHTLLPVPDNHLCAPLCSTLFLNHDYDGVRKQQYHPRPPRQTLPTQSPESQEQSQPQQPSQPAAPKPILPATSRAQL